MLCQLSYASIGFALCCGTSRTTRIGEILLPILRKNNTGSRRNPKPEAHPSTANLIASGSYCFVCVRPSEGSHANCELVAGKTFTNSHVPQFARSSVPSLARVAPKVVCEGFEFLFHFGAGERFAVSRSEDARMQQR